MLKKTTFSCIGRFNRFKYRKRTIQQSGNAILDDTIQNDDW